MKAALLFSCLFLTLFFSYAAKAQVESRENAKIPTLQMPCAEVMIHHINDPVDKAKGLGLMAMDYLNYNDSSMARITYDRFRKICPKIQGKNVRYHYLLKATNELSPILTELEKKTLLAQAVKDSAGFDIWNKIALGYLAANCGEYEQSHSLLFAIAQIRDSYMLETSGDLVWIYERDYDYSLDRILYLIREEAIFLSLESKFETMDKFIPLLLYPSEYYWEYDEWVDGCIIEVLNADDFDRAITLNEYRKQDQERAHGWAMIIDSLVARGNKEVAKQLFAKYRTSPESKGAVACLEKFYAETILQLDEFEAVKSRINYKLFSQPKCYLYLVLAEAYFERDQDQLAFQYLDSASNVVEHEVKEDYKIGYFLSLADLYRMNNESEMADQWLKTGTEFVENLPEGGLSRRRGFEQLVVHFADNRDYVSALGTALKLDNVQSASPRSKAINNAYHIAISNNDIDDALLLNDQSLLQLETIEHDNERNAMIEAVAIRYADLGNYQRAFQVAQRFSSNYYHGIGDFIEGFIAAYELNEEKQISEEYFGRFLDLLEIEIYYEHNYYTYKYLIESYYNQFYPASGFDFEEELIQHLERFDVQHEFRSKDRFNRMDQLLSMDLILFELYANAGDSEKLDALVDKAMEKCKKRRYKIQDLEDLLDIESKFLRYGKGSWGLVF